MPPMTKWESKLLSFVPLIVRFGSLSPTNRSTYPVALVCETLTATDFRVEPRRSLRLRFRRLS